MILLHEKIKYDTSEDKNPPADDIAQMISYIHVMDARKGEFVYPSKKENESGTNWSIRPFANTHAELRAKPFLISQSTNGYSDFKKQIQTVKNMIIK